MAGSSDDLGPAEVKIGEHQAILLQRDDYRRWVRSQFLTQILAIIGGGGLLLAAAGFSFTFTQLDDRLTAKINDADARQTARIDNEIDDIRAEMAAFVRNEIRLQVTYEEAFRQEMTALVAQLLDEDDEQNQFLDLLYQELLKRGVFQEQARRAFELARELMHDGRPGQEQRVLLLIQQFIAFDADPVADLLGLDYAKEAMPERVAQLVLPLLAIERAADAQRVVPDVLERMQTVDDARVVAYRDFLNGLDGVGIEGAASWLRRNATAPRSRDVVLGLAGSQTGEAFDLFLELAAERPYADLGRLGLDNMRVDPAAWPEAERRRRLIALVDAIRVAAADQQDGARFDHAVGEFFAITQENAFFEAELFCKETPFVVFRQLCEQFEGDLVGLFDGMAQAGWLESEVEFDRGLRVYADDVGVAMGQVEAELEFGVATAATLLREPTRGFESDWRAVLVPAMHVAIEDDAVEHDASRAFVDLVVGMQRAHLARIEPGNRVKPLLADEVIADLQALDTRFPNRDVAWTWSGSRDPELVADIVAQGSGAHNRSLAMQLLAEVERAKADEVRGGAAAVLAGVLRTALQPTPGTSTDTPMLEIVRGFDAAKAVASAPAQAAFDDTLLRALATLRAGADAAGTDDYFDAAAAGVVRLLDDTDPATVALGARSASALVLGTQTDVERLHALERAELFRTLEQKGSAPPRRHLDGRTREQMAATRAALSGLLPWSASEMALDPCGAAMVAAFHYPSSEGEIAVFGCRLPPATVVQLPVRTHGLIDYRIISPEGALGTVASLHDRVAPHSYVRHDASMPDAVHLIVRANAAMADPGVPLVLAVADQLDIDGAEIPSLSAGHFYELELSGDVPLTLDLPSFDRTLSLETRLLSEDIDTEIAIIDATEATVMLDDGSLLYDDDGGIDFGSRLAIGAVDLPPQGGPYTLEIRNLRAGTGAFVLEVSD